MRIAVVGTGALGTLFGGLLAKSGQDVLLLDNHPERAEHINRKGLRFEGISGDLEIPAKATSDYSEAEGADWFLFCVKAYSTAAAAEQIAPFVAEKSTVLTLQNGIGNVEKICEFIPSGRVAAGTTSNGANVRGPGHIHHAGAGETIVGELDGSESERLKKISEVLTAAGFPTRTSGNVEGLLWGKLLVNVGINPLTAILRIRNGEILERPPTLDLMHLAVLEAYRVCLKKGIKLEFPDPVKKVEEVARLTANNISSMHQDVRAGKQTEIDAICGAVVEAGREFDVETPINEMFFKILKAKGSPKAP
ncbi:MAG: 2-dehydropantoate 2-reductase [bacterium]